MNSSTLGAKLKGARENRGLSQDAVATALGIGRPAVSLIESGKRNVSTLELTRLATLLGYPVGALVSGNEEEEDLHDTLFRLSPELANVEDVRAGVLKAIELFRLGTELRNRLGFAQQLSAPTYNLATPSSTMDAVTQGRRVAADERRRLGLGNSPVSDLESLLLDQGIWVGSSTLPDTVSGLFLADRSLGLAVVVNARQVRGQRRFSLAHEYAYALMDRERQVTVSESSNAYELSEKRANAFAAAFLVPSDGIREQLQFVAKSRLQTYSMVVAEEEIHPYGGRQRRESVQAYDVASLAHHFGVSYQTIVLQLQNTGAVTRPAAERLKECEAPGKKFLQTFQKCEEAEGGLIDRELKGHLGRLILEAYSQELISRGKLLEMARSIEVPGAELLEIAEASQDE